MKQKESPKEQKQTIVSRWNRDVGQTYKPRPTTVYFKESDILRLDDIRKRLMRMEKDSSYSMLIATAICLLYRMTDTEIVMALICAERERKVEDDYRNLPDEIYVRTRMLAELKKTLAKSGFSEKDLANEKGREQILKLIEEESKKHFSKSKDWKEVLKREEVK